MRKIVFQSLMCVFCVIVVCFSTFLMIVVLVLFIVYGVQDLQILIGMQLHQCYVQSLDQAGLELFLSVVVLFVFVCFWFKLELS